jgi:hypothetical protein
MSNWIDRCHFGDCRDTMRAMIADGQIGHEPTLREFIETLTDVFELCRDLIADDGTAWVNMGDAYAGSWGAQGRNGQMSDRSIISARQITEAQQRQTATGPLAHRVATERPDGAAVASCVRHAGRRLVSAARRHLAQAEPDAGIGSGPLHEGIRLRFPAHQEREV